MENVENVAPEQYEILDDGRVLIRNWPAVGDIKVPAEWFQGEPVDIAKRINDATAITTKSHLEEAGVDVPSGFVFRESGVLGSTDVTRGVIETATGDRTTTPDEDMITRIFSETNPWASFFGYTTGSVIAPENLVPASWISAPLRVTKMGNKLANALESVLGSKSYLWEATKKDTFVGATLSGLATERPEYGYDFWTNLAYGAGGGALFGILRGGIGSKLGGVTAEKRAEIQAKYDEYIAQLEEEAPKFMERVRAAEQEQMDDPEWVQKNLLDAIPELDRPAVVTIDRMIGNLVQDFAEGETRALLQQGTRQIDLDGDAVSAAAARADFEENLNRQQLLTEQMQRRQYEADFNENLRNIEQGNQARIAQDFQERLLRNQQAAATRANLRNQGITSEEGQRRAVTNLVRREMIGQLSSSVQTTRGSSLSVAGANNALSSLRRELKNTNASIERARAGSTTRTPLPDLLQRQQRIKDNIELAVKGLNRAKERQKNVQLLQALKRGDDVPELSRAVDERLGKFDAKPRVEVPPVRQPEPPRQIETVRERQTPPELRAQLDMLGGQVPPVRGGLEPVQQQPQLPPASVIQSMFNRQLQTNQQAANQLPLDLQQRTGQQMELGLPAPRMTMEQARAQVGRPAQPVGGAQSMGAALVEPRNVPTGAAQAAQINTRTKAAQALPSSTSTVSRMNPETGEMESVALDSFQAKTERIRMNAIRDASQDQRELLNVDHSEGRSYDFDQLMRNATRQESDVLNDYTMSWATDIDETNYIAASEWLFERIFDKRTGDVRILTPQEKMVAARIGGIAHGRLIQLGKVQAQVLRDGAYNSRSIRLLQEMEINGRVDDAMEELTAIVNTVEMDRANTGRTLNALREANKEFILNQQKLLRKGYVDRVFLGVDC